MLSRHFAFMSALMLCLCIFTGCGKNPHIIDEVAQNGEIGGNDPIEPDPDPTPNPTPTPPPPPNARMVTLGARDYNKSVDQDVQLPYRTKKVKTIGFDQGQRDILCRFSSNDQCVHDRQVLFAFDIPNLGEIKKLHDVRIQANFITYGMSFDSEIICLNNIQTCSGNGIRKIPLLGLEKYVKKKWWNKDYWAAGYEDVVKNKIYQQALNKAKRINRLTRVTGYKDFSIRELFEIGDNDIISLLKDEKTLWFTVADDTYVMEPTLVVIYE